MLQGKKIILGVCGSIAAYKAAMLTRLLVKAGADVKIIMTESAKAFITPLTLSTLSKHPVHSDFFKNTSGEWDSHVELGLWADLILIAPATAKTISQFATGHCDNLLVATYLSARCPVYLAPAMDLDMYMHPSTLSNLQTLEKYGNRIINAESGELASGLIGQGRMAEPEHIVEALEVHFNAEQKLSGKRILITAGPTHEAIDPVRFIGNHSTGKMGYAIAEQMLDQGAEVTLVSGPTHCKLEHPNLKIIPVKSAEEMYQASKATFESSDITVLSAAVADYTPKIVADKKIKKKTDEFDITCVKTVDIAAKLGELKKNHQFMVGFALETDNEIENAKGKLDRKNLDMIVLNSLKDKGAGFGHDTNKVTILSKTNEALKFDLKSKSEVAKDIVNTIINYSHD
ncbi:bifunctional phosphopantothenoylcysteine decarboxylase/phosphopantothenate--cysteine ligase CoaBC [Aureibacter tunicatorum]|uniref:Coenzyme A biosynthesis bifunctional protein CoaBC n=1 Tax=Aureibacter tunicatorum TaxID=866807 RepID=A0AAE3XKG9_9BACT|nr:bifunctional phosphopantothenoylcysteine decarboxylase/phosphopantothenate--cysteine ligase CoaBC [Aureibacter tunicatorum]MDR6237659.1 phosphopantothenoylcysteine decarboxylase/phosphopantothenate--cysteine ligase [Aureibacter tunicatorum]BDD02694.1 phosphopantothenoylcysteine decarboxylase [Aureibacter tunicatorum]